jgi:hypothetical protein
VTRADGLRVLSEAAARYDPFVSQPAAPRQIVPPAGTGSFKDRRRAEWAAVNGDVAAWVEANAKRNEFAGDLDHALRAVGRLTDRQCEAVRRAIASDAAKPQATAPAKAAVNCLLLHAAFSRATERGEKWPSLRLDEFVFTLAASTARWPGSIYVKRADTGAYLGRITDGEFFPTNDCDPATAAKVVAAAANPSESAGAYGRLTGRCSCCGRPLSAAESINRAVGPVCWEKWFGGE